MDRWTEIIYVLADLTFFAQSNLINANLLLCSSSQGISNKSGEIVVLLLFRSKTLVPHYHAQKISSHMK